jgi:3-methyl-2-oxobutanoate hydroxymethyltransferase
VYPAPKAQSDGPKPISIADLLAFKRQSRKFSVITAYDVSSAAIADRAGAPVLLVGDSLGMVVLGYETTLPVTLDDMVRHSAAVVRGRTRSLVVADLPFLSYSTPDMAMASAGRLMQEAGVQAVKLEGGGVIAPTVRHLVQFGIPVMGHLGYTPQSTHQIGLKVQGKDVETARQLLLDALALEAAGAFAIVLELIPAPLAEAISKRLTIPTVGIGAGPGCDAQVQVWHDLLGIGPHTPRHAKRFAELGELMADAIRAYCEEVEAGAFPTEANSSRIHADVLEAALSDKAATLTA